jgi:hypothetical protein
MCLFRKKYTYIIKWSYGVGDSLSTDLIKGYDAADAWYRLKRQHAIPISLYSIKMM